MKISNEVRDAITELVRVAVDAVRAIAKALTDIFNKLLKEINPKVYHLAYNGKNVRIRNKNKRRLFKWLIVA